MWLWILATLVAFYVKGLCGFANTLVFTSILGFGTNNVNISPVELVLGYPTNFILTWKNRRNLKLKVWLPLAILVLLGSIPGALFLKNVDARIIKIIFGAVVVLLGMEMWFRESGQIHFRESKLVLGIIGVLSGALCGMFGVGALLAAYVGRVTTTSDDFKANISAVFIVENTVRLVIYGILGIITWGSLRQILLLCPFMLIGLYAGMQSGKILDEKIVKRLVIVFLVISGIVLIVKNLG